MTIQYNIIFLQLNLIVLYSKITVLNYYHRKLTWHFREDHVTGLEYDITVAHGYTNSLV